MSLSVDERGLFDRIERSDSARAPYSESMYSFLNRSAWPPAERVRTVLEDWFSRIPPEDQESMRRRFRAKEFDSVFHELLLHEVILRLGAKAELHPGEQGRTPDYRVVGGEVDPWYLEATVASDVSTSELLTRRLLNGLYDGINKLKPDGFFVELEHVALRSGRQPSSTAIRRFLTDELTALDPDRPLARPTLRYRDEDVELVFRPVALRAESRGDGSLRILGGPPSEGRAGGTAGPIISAVRAKGARYGRLPGPYVIGVNAISKWGTRREDMVAGLYGEAWTLTREQLAARRTRPGCGVLADAFTRVSAVFVTTAAPFNLGIADAALLHNPGAERGYDGEFCVFPQARLNGSDVAWREGRTLSDVLGLPAGWPW